MQSVLASTSDRGLFDTDDEILRLSPMPETAAESVDDIYREDFREWIDAI
ncbi:MAG: hypothetical protein ABGZ23_11115 [Fuerstiella sp.]